MRFRWPKTRGMLRREAATWLVRLRGPDGPEIEAAFRRWYAADPAHAAAYDRVAGSYAKAGLLRQSELGADRSLGPSHASRDRQPRFALAAAIALVLLVPAGLFLVLDGGIAPLGRTHALLLMTDVGEIRRVRLDDGSSLILDSNSKVEVELDGSGRRAVLHQGRARLDVAADTRPFVIESGQSRISARQALLDVELAADRSRVELLGGSATVVPGPAGSDKALLRIARGQGLVARGSGAFEQYRFSAARPDWTHGMLQFDATPLIEAAARANRYSDRKLLVAGDAGRLRVTGAHRAGDVHGLARSLATVFRLKLERSPSGDFLLSSPSPSTPAQRPAENKNGR